MTGATLGKAIFGIRTVDEQGNAPGLGKQFIRGVLWIVDGLCHGLRSTADPDPGEQGPPTGRRHGRQDLRRAIECDGLTDRRARVATPVAARRAGATPATARRRRARRAAAAGTWTGPADEPRRAPSCTAAGAEPRPDRSGMPPATRTSSGIPQAVAGSPTTTPPPNGSPSTATSRPTVICRSLDTIAAPWQPACLQPAAVAVSRGRAASTERSRRSRWCSSERVARLVTSCVAADSVR